MKKWENPKLTNLSVSSTSMSGSTRDLVGGWVECLGPLNHCYEVQKGDGDSCRFCGADIRTYCGQCDS